MSTHDTIKRVIDQSYGPFSDGVVERMAGSISRLPEIADAQARIAELEAALRDIAKRDGRASDHMACHDCGDSSNEAIAALKGEKS
jgi:hypothetical protein